MTEEAIARDKNVLLWDVLERLVSPSKREGTPSDELEDSDIQVRWVDVSGFGAYLEAHSDRIECIDSEDEWLGFVAEGASSDHSDIAMGCKAVHHLLCGDVDVDYFVPSSLVSQESWGIGKSAAIAHLLCSHCDTFGSAVSNWAQMQWLLRSSDAWKGSRLLYLSLRSGTQGAGLLAWLSLMDQDHLATRDTLDAYKLRYRKFEPLDNVVVFTGEKIWQYPFADDAIVPLFKTGAVLSLLSLDRKCPYYFDNLRLSGYPQRTMTSISRRSKRSLSRMVTIADTEQDSQASPAYKDAKDHLCTSSDSNDATPIFSTLNLFLGRRRRRTIKVNT
jgi:hypothetical protein